MGTQPAPQDVSRYLRDLERRIRALESGRPLENASIGSTGVFQVGTTATGKPILFLGTLVTGDGGAELRRQDGTVALRIGSRGDGTPGQSITVFDRAGSAALIDNAALLDGMERPSIAYPMQSTATALDVSVTSTTFVSVFEVHARKFNGLVEARFQARCSDGTTAGEFRLADGNDLVLGTGTDAQTPTVIPAGTTTLARFVSDQCQYPGPIHSTLMTVRVQVRRTAGTGSVVIRPGLIVGT